MVMPAITICTFLTVANSFKLFDQNLALTNGAPGRASAMMALDIFTTFYNRNGYEGVGQAKAVVFTIIVAAIVLLQLYFPEEGRWKADEITKKPLGITLFLSWC